MVVCFCIVEQCSAINNLSIASAFQLCNLKLCVTLGRMQKFFSLIWLLLLPVVPFKFTIFRYDCIMANFAKGFSWISRIGSRNWANFLSSGSCNYICRNFWQLSFTRKFFTRHYYLLAKLNHLEISCRGIKHILPMLSFNLTRSLSTPANHLGFTKPSNYLLLWYNYLLEAASLHHNKSSK